MIIRTFCIAFHQVILRIAASMIMMNLFLIEFMITLIDDVAYSLEKAERVFEVIIDNLIEQL